MRSSIMLMSLLLLASQSHSTPAPGTPAQPETAAGWRGLLPDLDTDRALSVGAGGPGEQCDQGVRDAGDATGTDAEMNREDCRDPLVEGDDARQMTGWDRGPMP